MTKRRAVKPHLFYELLKRFPQLSALSLDLLSSASSARTLFLRTECLVAACKALSQRDAPFATIEESLPLVRVLGRIRSKAVQCGLCD